MFYNERSYYLLCFCRNPKFGKNLVPEMWAKMLSANQIAALLYQPYLQNKLIKLIFWTNWFFACWCKLMKIKSLLKISWVGMVKSGCDHSCHMSLKLAVSQEWIDGVNWFFACWYKFRKRNLLGNGTLKYTVSQEWIYELSWYFACWMWCNNF